jgi:hypothetical protein
VVGAVDKVREIEREERRFWAKEKEERERCEERTREVRD